MEFHRRPRRLRQNAAIRKMVEEVRLSPAQLIMPFFVTDGSGIETPHTNLEFVKTYSVDKLSAAVEKAMNFGIRSILLFGVTSKRDAMGSEALNPESPVVQAITLLREKFPELLIASDVALDPYTDHGHDGVFENGEVVNDKTIKTLCEMSLLHAKAGVHMLAPSDMMDGRIGVIRQNLEQWGHDKTLIMSYTAKYASCLYGPFRDALGSSVQGDKKTYQMSPANRSEASVELELDLEEGADIVMVKPASWYLDIISDFKQSSELPVAAYQVSGECAMIEAGAKSGLFDRDQAILESLTSISRAGADLITTYFAEEAAKLLR